MYKFICVKCSVPYCGFYEKFLKIPEKATLRQTWWIAWKTVFNLVSRLEGYAIDFNLDLKQWYEDIEFFWDYIKEEDCKDKDVIFVKNIEGII